MIEAPLEGGSYYSYEYPYLRLNETPRVKFALGGRGGIGMFPTKAPTFAPGSRLSKTPSGRKQFPNPISA